MADFGARLVRHSLLLLLLAGPAAAQEACFRPIPPEALQPPEDDPEFRAFLSGEYEAYILEMQEYLNCLGREHESASQEVTEVVARWILYFGEDAALHSTVPENVSASKE